MHPMPRPALPARSQVFHAMLCLIALFTFARVGSAQSVSPNTNLTPDQQAARFLSQATFGPTSTAIAELRGLGYNYSLWIDREVAKPMSSAAALYQSAVASGAVVVDNNNASTAANRRARNEVMISGPDQLRQRVAYALSEIMVISDQDSNVAKGGVGSSDYYDMLARNAFGSFRTLMLDVTRHPMMGRYLSHYQNRKSNPTTGTRPDENYAREVMQLFTVGLYLLTADGQIVRDGSGQPIESYNDTNITEMARVFTGFTDESSSNTGSGTGRTDFPRVSQNYTSPMRMWEPQHDTGPKNLLNYVGARQPTLPANQTGLQDVEAAIDNLVEHPNTAPFIARQLIQRLVTSNPSPAYVGRVAAVFVNNGQGARGDLLAVVRAILLDHDARDSSMVADTSFGKLREPFLRVTHLLRACGYTVISGALNYDFGTKITQANLGQYPLSSPSVFNFYAPDYDPPGPIEDAGLVGPEFQVLTSVFAVSLPNTLRTLIETGANNFTVTLADQTALAGNSAALLDNLDLLFTNGTLSAATRAAIQRAVDSVTPGMVATGSTLNQTKARLAVYLIVTSPDYAIQK